MCNETEYTASAVSVTVSGRQGDRGRRTNSPLASGDSFVRLSAACPSTSRSQSSSRRASSSTVSSTGLAASTLVHRSTRTISHSRSKTPPAKRPAVSGEASTSVTGFVQPSRVDAIKRNLSRRGYSNAVTDTLVRSVTTSTSNVYDAEWRKYATWCHERGLDPFSVDGPQVAAFLVDIFEAGGTHSTLRGYKAGIFSVLDTFGAMDKDKDDKSIINLLFRTFAREKASRATPVPDWDLGLVLKAFTLPPFEPLGEIPLDKLIIKFTFLLALATGARRGELLALRRDKHFIRFKTDKSGVFLLPDPQFVPKGKRSQFCGADPLFLPSLGQVTGSADPDIFLCPVRCLNEYLRRTDIIREGRKRLLLPYNISLKNELSPQGLNFIFKKAILLAYSHLDRGTAREFKINLHQARLLSHSLAIASNVSLEQVLRSGHWAAQNTFTSFYFRSLAVVSDELYRLGPIAAAQSRTHPSLGLDNASLEPL